MWAVMMQPLRFQGTGVWDSTGSLCILRTYLTTCILNTDLGKIRLLSDISERNYCFKARSA